MWDMVVVVLDGSVVVALVVVVVGGIEVVGEGVVLRLAQWAGVAVLLYEVLYYGVSVHCYHRVLMTL